MKIKKVFVILASILLLTIVHIGAIYANANWSWGFTLLNTPQKEHLTILAICVSMTSFLIAAYALVTKGEIKLGGEVTKLENNSASIIFYNENDKRALIKDITLVPVGSTKLSPHSMELPSSIMSLEGQSYISLSFPPPSGYTLDWKLRKLKAEVTLINGDELKFDLKDGIKPV